VDAADDLSWCVLHYTGAAARAGSAYTGALLCSRDGSWPAQLDPAASTGGSSGYARAEAAVAKCGLKMWELYGHGPPGHPTPAHEPAASTAAGGEAAASQRASARAALFPGTEAASPARRGSYMWSDANAAWARGGHPPPLEPIGDVTVQTWRAAERAKAKAATAEATT
jgi:hypothetical protein